MSLGIVSRCKIGSNLDNQSVFACMLELGSQQQWTDLLRRDVGKTLARDQIQTDRGRKYLFFGEKRKTI